MAEIAHSQRLLRVRLVCRGCKFRPFSHANSPRLSLVFVYAWRFWPIVSAFVFSQRQLSLSASMHNTPVDYTVVVFITNCSTHVKLYFDHCLHVFHACMCMHSLHVFIACRLFLCEYSCTYLSSCAQNTVDYTVVVFISN